MRGVGECGPLADGALRVMRVGRDANCARSSCREFRELAEPLGIDLEFTEDEEMLATREEKGEVRLLVQERLQAQLDGIAARNFKEGFAEGFKKGLATVRAEALERERVLLHKLVALRFGAETAQQLDPLLAATEDPERLSEVGTWITDCVTGQDLLERLRNAD